MECLIQVIMKIELRNVTKDSFQMAKLSLWLTQSLVSVSCATYYIEYSIAQFN